MVSSYMRCPPKTGGAMRMVVPLSGMDPEAVSVDVLFGCSNEDSGARCVLYLNRIPAVRRAEYSVYEQGKLLADLFPSTVPAGVWSTISRNLLHRALRMIREGDYDIVQLEHSYLAWMAPYIRREFPDKMLIMDAHNIEYRILELWNEYNPSSEMRLKADALRVWEHRVWKWFDGIVTISAEERDIISGISGSEHAYHVPIAVDVSRYVPVDDTEKTLDILYIGTMEWYPNVQGLVWFLDEVMPRIEKIRPGTTFSIIGSGLQSQQLINSVKGNPNVTFLGFQPDDVSFLHSAKVFVVPLWIGAGARLKIPTAWAAGVPVVSTSLGAEGNGAVHGENILIADDPERFAECVLKALDDEDVRSKLIANASAFADTFTPENSADRLTEAYRAVLSRRCRITWLNHTSVWPEVVEAHLPYP